MEFSTKATKIVSSSHVEEINITSNSIPTNEKIASHEKPDFTYTNTKGSFNSFEDITDCKPPNNIFTTSNVEICGTIYPLKMYIDKDNIESRYENTWHKTRDVEITRDNSTICINIFNFHYHYTDIIYKAVGFPRACFKRAMNLQRVYIDKSHYTALIKELFRNEPMNSLNLFYETRDKIQKPFKEKSVEFYHILIDNAFHAYGEEGLLRNDYFLFSHENNIIDNQELGGKHGLMKYELPDVMLERLSEPIDRFIGSITHHNFFRNRN